MPSEAQLSRGRPAARRGIGFPLICCGILVLAACSFRSSSSARLTLVNPRWEKITIEVVLTNSANCDERGNAFVSSKEYTLRKDGAVDIVAPNAEMVCWRKERDPLHPSPGNWSGWAKATLNPGQTEETEI